MNDRISTVDPITVYPAVDNFDALADRLIMLFTHGRKITLIRRLIVANGPDQLEVKPDLVLDDDESFKISRHAEGFNRAVTFYFKHAETLTIATAYETEKIARHAWSSEKARCDRSALQVDIEGLGERPTNFDAVTVNRINEYGVQYSTRVVFHR